MSPNDTTYPAQFIDNGIRPLFALAVIGTALLTLGIVMAFVQTKRAKS